MSYPFITSRQLANTLNATIIDATMTETSLADHHACRIPGSKFWDPNVIKYPNQPNPAEVPTKDQF
jgi:hypothetical protein